MDNEAVNHEALSSVHWQRTRHKARQRGSVILMVQDITELDYTAHEGTAFFGPIGNHRGRGLLHHNTLAVEPKEQVVIGLAYQQLWVREEQAHKGRETRLERLSRASRQSQRWVKAVQELGAPPEGVRSLHVADREGDLFPFFQSVNECEVDFCVHLVQNRRSRRVDR